MFFFETLKATIEIHTIGYLPTIISSPTKMETVKELLVEHKEKVQQLNLMETNLFMDHATNSKSVEVVMKEQQSDLRDFI